MEKFNLSTEDSIKIDYWSNMSQSFVICGFFNPEETFFLPEEELVSIEGRACIILRLSNCTGNLIDLSKNSEVSEEALTLSQIALSVDEGFKRTRRRTLE